MSPTLHQLLSFDLPAALTAALAAVSCAILGNFLILRRESLMGDAISHAVLPGLVAAFAIAGTRATWPMFLGAAAAGFITVVLIELLRRLGRVEPGAAMGVVFSIMFALGVLLLQHAARGGQVDLDADCVLYGQLEAVFWFPPDDWPALLTLETLADLPRQLVTLAVVTLLTVLFVAAFFKELRLAAFDPALATSLGFNATALHLVFMGFVAAAVVASFEAVGSILVVAMLICPAATARLLTDRLLPQILWSVAVAVLCGLGGYILAATAPAWLGTPKALSAAGMMTVVSGVLLAGAILLAPSHGVLAKSARRFALAVTIAREDLLAMLYRVEERGNGTPLRTTDALAALGGGAPPRLALRRAIRANEVARDAGTGALTLTPAGRDRARTLVRTHRLWETYLVERLGLRPDHVHRTAESLEHLTSPPMHALLTPDGATPAIDPQGKPIP